MQNIVWVTEKASLNKAKINKYIRSGMYRVYFSKVNAALSRRHNRLHEAGPLGFILPVSRSYNAAKMK
jgi:hypothetical protein